ncbi:hypothetical protein AB0C02_00535 [Micromonospora sp. NPDC048999]|uniref:hypothetical protein n=1 Tax=Micromonospora sp. NPDC048999 TaxID=3155391 RepID=UPI0033C5657F
MSHPQPPFGPQDPNQQPAEPPTQAFPTAPMPPVPGNPYAPQPPVSGAPQPPYPPVFGAPQPAYPPVSGGPQPAYPPQPPAAGGPYPPPGDAYPPGPYPPAPGQPFGAPPPAKKSNKNVWIIVGIVAAVLLLLCCGGGIFAVYNGFDKAREAVESLPTSGVTADPFDDTPTGGPESTPGPNRTDGETFNMKPGETLVVTDDQGTVEITVSKFHTKNKACKAYLPEPKNGLYLIADVTAEVTKGTGSINPFYFSWIDTNGNEENGLEGALSGCGKLLGSGVNLAAGSKRTGQLVFDVTDTNGTLEYEHQLETAGSWRP